MAPWLQKVSNGSGKRVHVHLTDGKAFAINDGESEVINDYVNADAYTKIDRELSDYHEGFLLVYNDYNICLTDNRGKEKGIGDYPVHTWKSTEYINIDIYSGEMKIWCDTNDLGIYQSDGYPKYYKSVIVTHIPEGGVRVRGFETVEGATTSAAKKEEDENEEASAKMKEPNA